MGGRLPELLGRTDELSAGFLEHLHIRDDSYAMVSYYFLDLTALGRQEEWEEPKGRTDSARSARLDFAS